MENGCKCHRAAHKNTNHLCCMPQKTCARAHTHTVVVAAPANAHTPHTHGRSRRRARKRTHAARARPKSSSCPHCQTVVHTTTPHPHRILLSTKSTPRRSWAAAARAAPMGVGTAAPRRRHCCCLAVRALWRLYHGRKRVDSVMYNTTIISLETLNNLLAPNFKTMKVSLFLGPQPRVVVVSVNNTYMCVRVSSLCVRRYKMCVQRLKHMVVFTT